MKNLSQTCTCMEEETKRLLLWAVEEQLESSRGFAKRVTRHRDKIKATPGYPTSAAQQQKVVFDALDLDRAQLSIKIVEKLLGELENVKTC